MDLCILPNALERRRVLEAKLQVKLEAISRYSFTEESVVGRNIENMLGAIQVPLGIAGPLKIQGQEAKGEFYVPLATTEGALVASINRGSKAITQSGGATVLSEKIGTTRSLVFAVSGIQKGKEFINWAEKNIKTLKKIAESTSSHLVLKSLEPTQMGTNVYLRFSFDTKDAMGMNMATIASSKMADFIVKETGIVCVSVSSNMCVDKKPNYLNFILGRGIRVWAEVCIPRKLVFSILKTTPAAFVAVFQSKIMYGSMLSGSIGANAHIANVIAAFFLATGQDIAHVSECSSGVTTVEQRGKDLYISVYLPDLMLGTVGGGTGLPTQKEALSILGIKGGNNGKNAQKLAEIVGGTVLAGEISLIASLSNNTLSRAHEKLGRGKG